MQRCPIAVAWCCHVQVHDLVGLSISESSLGMTGNLMAHFGGVNGWTGRLENISMTSPWGKYETFMTLQR